MDLHNYKPALSEFDFSNFGYLESYAEPDAGWLAEMEPQFIRKTDEDQTAICVPLRGLGSFYTDRDTDSSNEEYDEKGGAHFLHHTPISLLLYAYYNPQKPIPGNYVILCPRAPEVFPGQPASIIDLPFTEEDWRRIVNMFHVSASIIRTVMRSVAYFSSGRNNASTKSGKRQLQISYTARMSDSLSDDLALSSTYHPHARTTYSIMYGCNKDHVQDIQRRIDSAGEDADHPLLMMGIFAELEYRRLIDEAEKIVDEFTLESDMLEQGSSWDPNSGKMQQHLEICLRSNTLADHIRTVKRQLAKVSTDIDDLIRYWQSREYISLWTQHNHLDKDVEKKRQERMIEIALQMSSRIRDIQDEYDDKIDECKKMAQNMSLAMQTGYNQIARRDAETNTQIARANTDIAIQTKRESSQMRNIALLTMVFLPLSCVASVFSTTIFNWDGEEGHPIVSGYIWVLLGIALILTIVTMLGWWFLTRRERKREGKEEKTKNKKDIDLEKGQQT